MSSTNVVALKGPGEGALRGHPDRKSPRSHSNFVTFHMHSICRRRKAFCLGPINTLATSVTTPQTPPPQIGIRPWLWADALNLQRAAVGAVRSCKELLLRYAEDSSDPLQMFPSFESRHLSQSCRSRRNIGWNDSLSVSRDDANPRSLRPIFFFFSFFFSQLWRQSS